jgi:hypothetical protein
MHLFSYWSGEPTWLERLSVDSALATGHDVTVYTYGDRAGLSAFLGCRVLPADLVSSDPRLDELRRTRPDHFSDHFRLEGIAADLGTWFDLDIIFLRPLPVDPYIFGWQNDSRVGNSILRFPNGDACLRDYLAFCRQRPMARYVMPWYPWAKKLTRCIKAAIEPLTGIPAPSPKYGPDALTHFVLKSDLSAWIRGRSVYYPVPIKSTAVAQINNPGFVDGLLRPDTICVHAWRTTYMGIHGPSRPRQGWLADQLAHYARKSAKQFRSEKNVSPHRV